MVNLVELRKRHAKAKQAEYARSALLDDLLQTVDDMQKQMDRNAFIMVLIDGDCMKVSLSLLWSSSGAPSHFPYVPERKLTGDKFLDDLVKQGITGGDEAAKLLRRAVFDHLRYDANFKLDHKIVVRVYANVRGLSKAYSDEGVLLNPNIFSDFALGFNQAHPLCELIDAGNHKKAAETKLKGTRSPKNIMADHD